MQFKAWSPSRLADYTQCPRMAMHKHLEKRCTKCFQGKIQGGFDTPAICDTCGETIVKPEAIERGTKIGDALDKFLMGKAKAEIPDTIRHPDLLKLVTTCKKQVAEKTGVIQPDIVLNNKWEPCKGWDPKAWLRCKLDYVHFKDGVATVIDWKTGGIDKRDGSVRADPKYFDQLAIYSLVTLCAFPNVNVVEPSLAFLDCGPRFHPFVQRGSVHRKDLAKAKKSWIKEVTPMLSDEEFAPRPSDKCRWCDYSNAKGGPCAY